MPPGEVDLNLLLVLERVLVRQSVAEAAEDLGLSPSATSRALQRLRDALGDPLLVRAGNRLVPTDLGRELVEPAIRAVEAARAVFGRERRFDPEAATGDFVLALGAELQQVLLPAILRRLRAVAPGIDVRVRELTLRSAEEGHRDALQLALGPDLSGLPSVPELPELADVVQRPLYVRRFVVLGARAAWPTPPDRAAYVAAEHVLVAADAAGRGFVDDVLALHGCTRRVICTVTTFAAAAEVVRRTRALAAVPAEFVRGLVPELIAHPPPVPLPEMEMRLYWHPRYTTQPRHRFLRDLIADVVERQLDPLEASG